MRSKMHKLMIIDDDIPMLKYLNNMLSWQELGLELVYSTSSSMEALEALDEHKPDIIVTDIGLPKIDGIELASKAMQKNKLTRIIFVTCHEDFSYAKKAVQLKADDYLVKEELTPEILKQSLQKSISVLLEQGIYNKQNIIENQEFLKQTFINKLLKGSSNIKNYASKLNFKWRHPDFKMIIGYLPMMQDSVYHSYNQSLKDFYYTLSNLFYDNDNIDVFLSTNHVVLFYNYRENIKHEMELYLQQICEVAVQDVKHKLSLNGSFIIVKQKFHLEQMGNIYQQLIKNRYRYFYRPVAPVQHIDLNKEYSFIPLGNLIEFSRQELIKAIKNEDVAGIAQSIAKVYDICKRNNVEPRDIMNQFFNVSALIELSAQYSMEVEAFHRNIQLTWTMQEVFDVLQKEVLRFINKRQKVSSRKQNVKKIQEINAYIAKNIAEDIRSVDMANYLYLNPSYFSRYFKKLTGYTFTDYVYRYKMKAASRFLLQSDEPVESIGLKVGFHERTYFTKVFKKYTGKTPSEYRNVKDIV